MKLKIVLLIALFAAFVSVNIAQTKKSKTKPKAAATAEFVGSPQTDKAAFKSFIIKNIGKKVSLKLTFDGEDIPYGYRSEFADPLFNVDNYTYFFACGDGDTTNIIWEERCRKINWNAEDKTVIGFFRVTESNPRLMRTNRSFTLMPTK